MLPSHKFLKAGTFHNNEIQLHLRENEIVTDKINSIQDFTVTVILKWNIDYFVICLDPKDKYPLEYS